MRQRSRFGGVHVFAGARYLYRGAAGAGVTASGAAIEGGLVYNPGVAWTLHASLAGTWLARAEVLDGANTVVLPQVFEVRATLGTGWRATFDPDKSLTLGVQTSISWNFWQNDFARAAQTSDVRGWALEASLFASGHLGTNFNGLLSFGVLLPYGTLDDGPRFVFTFAPSAAAATSTRVSDTPCPRCAPCAQCPQMAPSAPVVQPVPAVPAVVPVAVATPTASRGTH
jgi:hypothetical protein